MGGGGGKDSKKVFFDKRFSVQKWYTTVTVRDVLTDHPVRVSFIIISQGDQERLVFRVNFTEKVRQKRYFAETVSTLPTAKQFK